jgi:hypothetical protein
VPHVADVPVDDPVNEGAIGEAVRRGLRDLDLR